MKHSGWVAAAALLCACSSPLQKVQDAWKKAGHQVSELKPVERKIAGGNCSSGTVAGFEATLCEFDNETQATQAQASGLEVVADNVGASIAAGKLLLVVADRRKTDPTGRKLNEIIKVFHERMH
ncbi:MAG TPA: hypothetical protein VE782_17560 [Myxococcaceae bacterium]|jgi:hypothetical protein|nr:hypothetical protein [Myxococcaceae bacterium]